MRPENCRYLKSHEWARLDGDTVTVGITDFAVNELSDLVFIDLPDVGASIDKGERFGEIESVKAVSDLYAPVSGEIVEVNADLADNVDAINDDPFGAGWMIKIKVSGDDPLAGMLTAAEYDAQVES